VTTYVEGSEYSCKIEEVLCVDLAKYKIPKEAIDIEDAGNKKGRKR
jgi:hypothetical protein